MKLTIVAATGGTGRALLDQALAAGHDVTAVARNPRDLPPEANVVKADMTTVDPADLAPAVLGADAVLSCLGPRGKADHGVCAAGTGRIVEAMKATGARRLIVISSESMTTVPSPGNPNPPRHDPGEGFLLRHVVGPPARRFFLRDVYADLGVMEDLVRASGLDWTIARPALLVDKPLTGVYRTAVDRKPRGGFRISYADLGHFMLRCLQDEDTVGKAISLNY
ncbi:NAD(P)-dependent oxidoreductase [Thermomonospora umbrina]|uniref:Putative NADH-flavin reductase n=1 Tax=Thermomonospora umbrina TaxID=111806 RepID=A0A3D9SQP5_9ACTN|nr:SDR family oxidoreductase [Thermomonospora umbrina]REE98269.1 putative NADH-flavin reductase [Thermomonospora umbrina]